MLEEFTAENDFIILNSGEQTFVHSAYHSTSAIDLAVASPSIAAECSWTAHSDLCGSDHFPIFLTFMSNFISNVNASFNFKKADWNRFEDLCKLSLDDSVADIEQFTSELLDAARSSIPFHKGTKHKTRVPWFTQECPDGVYYQFLRHLPESCLHTLLKLFNNIWTTGDIPPSWREASVVPIPKPGKDPSDPSNYRPIALTSCLCKTLERIQRIYIKPALHLDGQPIPVKGEAKFLGVVFDSKLNFSSHVKYLKKKCLKALNLLRVVGHTDWGADRATLLKLYRTLFRSKLDYDSVIYGSAKKHVLRALDPIHHQGLRIALGAFRTSPIKSLYAEAGKPSLEHWLKSLIKKFFRIKEQFSNHYAVFTDGSKLEEKVAAAAYFPEHPDRSKATCLRDGASVLSAELEGIALALTEIKKLTKYHKNFDIFSDSLSALQAIQSKNFKIIDIRRQYNVIRKFPPYVHISFVWIPAHVGIQGNENVDKLAKAALNRASCSGKSICYSDLKPKINTYINSVWQRDWDAEGANKLHEVLPNLGEDLHRRGDGGGRKQETAMCRLRLGHTWLTQSYLLKNEEQPFCYACDSLYTVRHILIECPDFQDTRRKYFSVTDLYRLFREVNPSRIAGYLKDLGVYGKI
ncbi:RNA-directed DNA polymerase from mobile element jockey [Plakobranchus ocellatus]|uniref:RNA-directed DNA polymerase from mobile element jockey n=1 Tax=Plakobranchus ocellatus TaxID=259542 RepID=A0AAV4DCR7_9GAST|nr:RNA-directed DNA polymerase from mobile element jockey [Plakobranchus ocellatus]